MCGFHDPAERDAVVDFLQDSEPRPTGARMISAASVRCPTPHRTTLQQAAPDPIEEILRGADTGLRRAFDESLEIMEAVRVLAREREIPTGSPSQPSIVVK